MHVSFHKHQTYRGVGERFQSFFKRLRKQKCELCCMDSIAFEFISVSENTRLQVRSCCLMINLVQVLLFQVHLLYLSFLATSRLCSFNRKSDHRNSRTIRQQCGDAMNIHVMSVLHLHSLVCYRWQVPSNLMQSLHIGRKMLSASINECIKRPRMRGKMSQKMIFEKCQASMQKASRGPMVCASAPSTPNIELPATSSCAASSASGSGQAVSGQANLPDATALQAALINARRSKRRKM